MKRNIPSPSTRRRKTIPNAQERQELINLAVIPLSHINDEVRRLVLTLCTYYQLRADGDEHDNALGLGLQTGRSVRFAPDGTPYLPPS